MHIYHRLVGETNPLILALESLIEEFYSEKPMDIMEFGEPGTKNERIYTATIFGAPGYQTSITIVHLFYGTFKVTSMLTRVRTS